MSADRIKICQFQGSDDISDSCTARQSARDALQDIEKLKGKIDPQDLEKMATELPILAEEDRTTSGQTYDRCSAADDPEAQLACNRNPFRS